MDWKAQYRSIGETNKNFYALKTLILLNLLHFLGIYVIMFYIIEHRTN